MKKDIGINNNFVKDDDWDSDFDMGDKDLREALNYSSGLENYKEAYQKINKDLHNGILEKYDKNYAQELLHFAGGYSDWTHKFHHAGFDIVSNRILEVLNEYKNSINGDIKEELCYWVTGHRIKGTGLNIAILVTPFNSVPIMTIINPVPFIV